MAHVVKVLAAPREAKQWECRWSFPNPDDPTKRKFQKQRFRTRAEAEAKEREIEDRRAQGLTIDHRAGKETVEAWAERWFAEYQRRVKPNTARKSRGLLDATVIPRLGHRKIRDVQAGDVAEWLAWIEDNRQSRDRKGKISPATIKHHYLVLSNVLQFAAERRAIAMNPARGVRLPTNRTRGRLPYEPHFLTPAEVDKLAAALPYPYGLMVQFMAFTGLRVGEMAGLNMEDVDLVQRTVQVRRTRAKHGCTARCRRPDCRRRSERNGRQTKCQACAASCSGGECCWEIHTPKSGKARTTTLPRGLADALRDYLDAHPHRDEPDAPLWPGRKVTGHTRDGNTSGLDYDQPWNSGVFFKRHFKPAVKLAGLPADLRLHDLRHTFASICASNGVPAAQVAEWMGHGNEVVTRTIYTHLFKEDTTLYADALDAAFAVGGGASNVVPINKGA